MQLVLTNNNMRKTAEPFLRSLRGTGYGGDIAIMSCNANEIVLAEARQYQAHFVPCEADDLPLLVYAGRFKRLLHLPAILKKYFKNDYRCLNMGARRVFEFRNYLSDLKVKPEQVLIADCRDVIFQRNPFPFQEGLTVGVETNQFKTSKGNVKWLWEAAGINAVRKMWHFNVLNGGVIAGDYATMCRYLDLVIEYINKNRFFAVFDGVDQGALNHIVHNKIVSPTHLQHNWNGVIATLDKVSLADVRTNEQGKLINQDGSIIPIIHQYDRVKGLAI